MSEYQYYEFLAIDRPLTAKEQEAVGQFSTRAVISATSFTNEYHWGDFRGDPHKFLEKWFDAHVYLANWGTRRFMFRVPKDVIDLSLARACCDGDAASIEVRGEQVIFDLALEPEDGGDWDDAHGSGWMATLAPARADLLRGDLRILYLGWLLRVQNDEFEDEDVEPFLPPGLSRLSASLKGLVNFLGIDADLLEVAAEMSGAGVSQSSDADFAAWVAALPAAEKDAMLLSFCEGRDPMLAVRLRRRFEAARPKAASEPSHRTVRELRDGAARQTEKRERKEAEAAARKHFRAMAEAEALRTKQLDELAAREPEAWRDVAKLILSKTSKGYDEAVALLRGLRDLAARADRGPEFSSQLNVLRGNHSGKPSFIKRLSKAGL